MTNQTYTLRILCMCYIPVHARVYLLFCVLQSTVKKSYEWIQNYNARSYLSFGYKGKTTIATSKVNTFKIVL